MDKYTVFLTYNFSAEPYSSVSGGSHGFGESIHCNYIQNFETYDVDQKTISFYFKEIDEFKFLFDITGGTNLYSVNKINAIIQIVKNSDFDDEKNIKPSHTEWKKIDVSDQIIGYDNNISITPEKLMGIVFEVPYQTYVNADTYTLDYLSYPTDLETDKLSFGEESFFFGNVTTDIEAIAYTTDIPIVLNLGDFNVTTNPTWDNESDLLITEVGIYDNNNNLVGIGKLTNPISKSESIGRTIVFAIDF